MRIPPPPLGSYNVVLVDFPWRHETYSEAGQAKSASRHYDTMTTDEIIALYAPLRLEWACDPHTVFVMWTTWALLAAGDAHRVMHAYGFKPITGGAWFKETKHGKDGFGLGYIFRDSCEPFLVGTRGDPGLPAVRNVRNGFRAKLGRHSEKPEYLHRALERMYPNGRYLELFARSRRDGWTCWGLEVDGPAERPAPAPMPPAPTLFDTQRGNEVG